MTALDRACSWLVPVLVGGLTPLLVMTGTHYGLFPVAINNRLTLGYDSLLYPGMLASNVAQGAAALGVALKSKNSEIKQLATSTGVTAGEVILEFDMEAIQKLVWGFAVPAEQLHTDMRYVTHVMTY